MILGHTPKQLDKCLLWCQLLKVSVVRWFERLTTYAVLTSTLLTRIRMTEQRGLASQFTIWNNTLDAALRGSVRSCDRHDR